MTRRKSVLPKGVWFQRKRLADGSLVRYGYLGRGPGSHALGREGSAEFHANLADALRKAPPDGTVASLIYLYRQSRAFKKLGARTQADYLKHLDRIRDKFGPLSLRAMQSPTMADHIERWRDGLAEASPRQADYAATVLKLLLSWGVRRGKLSHNPAAGLEKVYTAARSEMVWTDAQVWALAVSAPEPIRRALIIGLETGISEGDLLTLSRSADRGRIIVGRRAKTGAPFAVPVSPLLRACLDAAPKTDATTILTKADGRPWEPKGNGFRQAWRDAVRAAEIDGLTFNDLRGTFITGRRARGWGAEPVALCSGHPIEAERGAQKAYAGRETIAVSNAERLFSEHYANETCKPACKPAAKHGS